MRRDRPFAQSLALLALTGVPSLPPAPVPATPCTPSQVESEPESPPRKARRTSKRERKRSELNFTQFQSGKNEPQVRRRLRFKQGYDAKLELIAQSSIGSLRLALHQTLHFFIVKRSPQNEEPRPHGLHHELRGHRCEAAWPRRVQWPP